MAGSNERGGRASLALVTPDQDTAWYSREVCRREGSVLVLGCADGKIAAELALLGRSVVGADPSPWMIQAADERRKLLFDSSDRFRCISADLRALRLGETFSWVVAPQNALGLMASLEDLEALMATVRSHLAPDGTFAFDISHLSPPERPRSGEEDWQPLQGLEPIRPPFLPHLRERARTAEKAGIRRLRLRHFRPEEIESALKSAGLVATERYGDFLGKPFSNTDDFQVCIAIRA